MALLEIDGLVASYGHRTILEKIDLRVEAGERIGIIGHNGAGKSTLLKAVMGIGPTVVGGIRFNGASVVSTTPAHRLRAGIGLVGQGSQVFATLTVKENLELAAGSLLSGSALSARFEEALGAMPEVRPWLARQAGTLSGGERQSVALAMAMMTRPRLLLLDEPSLGLAPGTAKRALERLTALADSTNVALVLAEQNVRHALELTSRTYVLRRGTVSYEGPSSSLEDRELFRRVFL